MENRPARGRLRLAATTIAPTSTRRPAVLLPTSRAATNQPLTTPTGTRAACSQGGGPQCPVPAQKSSLRASPAATPLPRPALSRPAPSSLTAASGVRASRPPPATPPMAGSAGALECPGFFSYKGFKRMGVESEGVRRGCLWLESSLQVSERGAALAGVLKRWRAAAYQRLRVSLTLHLARRALSGCELRTALLEWAARATERRAEPPRPARRGPPLAG